MGFPERLAGIMKERDYTMYRLAKDTDISATTISNYRKGKTNPDSTKLDRLCEKLGVNKVWLLTGEEPKYTLEDPEAPYTPLHRASMNNNMVDKLVDIINQQLDSMREKDLQISELIRKIPDQK